jgi:hypothetical protein
MTSPSNIYRRFLPIDQSLTTKAWNDISHRLGLTQNNPGVFGIRSIDGNVEWNAGTSGQFLESIDPATGTLLAKTSKVSFQNIFIV